MNGQIKIGLIVFIIIVVVFIALNIGGINSKKQEEAVVVKESNIKLQGNTLTVELGKDKLVIEVCTSNIVRVNFLPNGEESPDTPIIGDTSWSEVEAEFNIESDPMTIKTDRMIVKIDKEDYRISIYDKEGKLLIGEQDTDNRYNNGVRFNHGKNHNFYGIFAEGARERSGEGILRNDGGIAKPGTQGECGAPFVWSTNGYGILIDSVVGRFSIDDTELTFTANTKKDIEYYVVLGEPKEILSSLFKISGRPPMFPKWSMGFMNTEWGIDQQELLEIVDTYREKNIPIDAYILDFDWKAWGEDNYGEFRWNEEKFPDGPSGKLKEMMDKRGIKLIGIMKPRIHVNTEQGRYATEHGFWCEGRKNYIDYFSSKIVNDLDFSKEECREWYFEQSKKAFDTGIIGWWNDEADEGFDPLQFLNMQRGLYEGQRKYTNQRVWSINRNFLLGSQRYAYGTWSGDINTGFESMAKQRENMLSAINVGQMKWGMDTGGFNGKDPSPENYARWMQFSAFTPIFRVHGTEGRQRQPWVFGEQAENVAKEAIELRYKLIPYIYSYERKAYETGIGIVRPLVYDYPDDKNTANYIDAWMFGDYLLVSPIVEKGQKVKEIYLPEGMWIDYFRGDKYQGGQTIKYKVNNKTWEDIPLFVKDGGIIPTQDCMNYVGEKPVTTIYVDVFPTKEETHFKYYDDDGTTYDYEKGEYFIQQISVKREGNKDVLKIHDKDGTYTPDLQYYIYKVHGETNGNDVMVNNESIHRYKDLNSLLKGTEEGWINTKDIYGSVTYVKIKAGYEKEIVINR
jgi:alpha-glucosidase